MDRQDRSPQQSGFVIFFFDLLKLTGIIGHKELSINRVLYSFGLIAAAGYAWRFFDPGGLDRHKVRRALNAAVLHFFLPALAFSLMATTRVDRSFLAVPLTAAVVTLLGFAVGFVVYKFIDARLAPIPRPSLGALILAAALGNVTYLGLPLITEMLGEQFGYVAILYDLLASTPLLLTAGVFIAARYGEGETVSIAASIRRVLMLPPLWGAAAGIGFLVTGVTVPDIVLYTTRLMGKAVIPVMIFTVGLALDFKDLRRLPIAMPALVLKLVMAPVLAWWVGSQLGISSSTLKAVALEGATPVMVLSLVIADEFKLDVPLAAACITVSTVASFFTIPVMMGVLF